MSQSPPSLRPLLACLEENQAIDVLSIDVHDKTTITEQMVICSGRSSRHVKALATHAMESLKKQGFATVSLHGLDSADWVLIDFGDLILHIMQPNARAFYYLEGLWQDATPS